MARMSSMPSMRGIARSLMIASNSVFAISSSASLPLDASTTS
jgi:hypothetical protein